MTERLFAIGDIHGCFDKLRILIEDIIDVRGNDYIVLLGDYIDRGNQSKEVIDYILQLKAKGYRVIPLMGNHEKMLLDSLSDNQKIHKWIANGGSATLNSFGIKEISKLNSTYQIFFNSLLYYHLYKEFLFVHAGFNDGIPDPFTDEYHMLWQCRSAYNSSALANKIIVHGHRPISVSRCQEQIFEASTIINIDTGCVYSDSIGYGKLSAIEVNSMTIFSI